MAINRTPPYPYSFQVRKLGEARDKNVGFMTKLFDEPGIPWTEDVFGGIPGVLNRGGSEINFGENVEYSGWDRLDRGGMGAEFANDRTRYRLTAGLYCGDPGEVCAQPKTFSVSHVDGDIPAWERKEVVLPPAASTTFEAGGVTSDATFRVTNATGFQKGASCRIRFSATVAMTAGSATVTITDGTFGDHDDDEHVIISVAQAGLNGNALTTTVEKFTDVNHVEVMRKASQTVTPATAYVAWGYERRIKDIVYDGTGTGAVITVDQNLVNLGPRTAAAISNGNYPLLIQYEQKIVDMLIWRIPPAVPDAMVKPQFKPVITDDAKSDKMETGDGYYFVFTKLSPWGESLPSDPNHLTVPHPVAGQKSLAIQFGANDADITTPDANGTTFKANTKDYPGVTGYRIYAQVVENGTTPPDAYAEEKLKFVAEVTVNPNQQVNQKLKPRFIYKGEALGETRPPEYTIGVSDTRRDMVVIVSTDGIRTYLYRLDLHGTTSTLAPIQPVSDIQVAGSEQIVPGVRGTITPHSCTIWNGQLLIPTTDSSGRQAITRVWYDSTKGNHADGYSLKFRYRVSEGILGHLVYAENTRRLWRIYKNLAYWSSDPFGGTPEWTGPISIGNNEYDVTQAISYGGAKNSSDSATYFTKPDGLYRILDTDQGPSRRAEWITTFGVPDLNYGYPLIDHRGELYIGIGENMLRYTIANVDLAGPNRDRGLVQSLRGWCGGAISTNRHLYIGTGMRYPDKKHFFYQQILETEQGEAWHQIRWHGPDGNQFLEVMPEATGSPDFGAPDGVGWGPILLAVPADMSSGDSVAHGDGWTTMVATTGYHGDIEVFPIRNAGERLRESRGYQPDTRPAMLELPKTFSGNNRPLDQIWHYLRVAQVKLTQPANFSGFRVQYLLDNPFTPDLFEWTCLTYSNDFGGYQNYLTVNETRSLLELHYTDEEPPVAIPPPPGGWQDLNWLYAIENVVQFISGGERHAMLPDDSGFTTTIGPIQRSPGISFRLDINQEEGIPLVLGEIILASSPTTVPLGRWVFEAVLKRYQQLAARNQASRSIENMTNDEFYLAYEQLFRFAKSSDPLVLTDALGAEHVCRMDLGHVSPGKDGLKTWTKPDDENASILRVVVEPYELRYTVTFTELYNLDDMPDHLVPPIVPA